MQENESTKRPEGTLVFRVSEIWISAGGKRSRTLQGQRFGNPLQKTTKDKKDSTKREGAEKPEEVNEGAISAHPTKGKHLVWGGNRSAYRKSGEEGEIKYARVEALNPS